MRPTIVTAPPSSLCISAGSLEWTQGLTAALDEAVQPIRGRAQRLELLRKGKSDLRAAELRPRVERGSGDDGDARGRDELTGEGDVIGIGQGGDVGHRVIGAIRAPGPEAGGFERLDQHIPALAIPIGQRGVVGIRQ